MKIIPILLLFCLFTFTLCTTKTDQKSENTASESNEAAKQQVPDTVPAPIEIKIEKELLYDQHTLADSYPYKDTTRRFQWDKIRSRLALLDSVQQKPSRWAILQNYKNKNGEAPLVREFHRDAYKRISDTQGVERYQSVPLYLPADTTTAEQYGRDGVLVRLLSDNGRLFRIETIHPDKEWFVPGKYVSSVSNTVAFRKAIFVDVTNQNIATLEHTKGSQWLVRSMNPATTGQHRPPYAQETPLGMFVIQEKKAKMIYLVDGSKETGGFAPYASRFTNGGYIHGVPVNAPGKSMIEYSSSLGTTPRSHMCVRNATSHAKFVYDWSPVNEVIVFVFD